ncbi:MAG: alpha/beta hydrolase [Acidimicrobiia bacterium]
MAETALGKRRSLLAVTFEEARKSVFESYGGGDYETGLQAIDRYASKNDDEVSDLSYWRMCLLSRLDRVEEACAEFAQRLDQGFWWGDFFLLDTDLDQVREHPEWRRLATLSLDRARETKRVHRSPIDLLPDSPLATSLILFHGGAERPDMMINRCSEMVHQGCRLVALHGTEPSASARFGWPLGDSEQVVSSQVHEVGELVRPILVGYSQGAGLAGYLAWGQHLHCAGVVLVAPAWGIRGVPIPTHRLAPVRTYVLAGGEDWAIEDTRHATDALETSGVPVLLDERPGLGHDWPEDSAAILSRAIAWMLNE